MTGINSENTSKKIFNAFLFTVILLFSPINTHAQIFINNPDYIWGEGRGSTMEEADQKALESLLTSLTVNVAVRSTLSVSDINGDLSKSYQGNITTNSSLNLTGIQKYVDTNFSEGYKIYRYLNKSEYVSKRKDKSAAYLALAKEKFYGSKYSGTINLTLGYYYLAYRELNDDVLSFLDSENEVEKARILHHIKTIIRDIEIKYRPASLYDYDWSDILAQPTRPSYDPDYLHVSVYYGRVLMNFFDFEYWDGAKWSDNYVWNDIGSIAEIKCTASVPRNIKDLKYRVVSQTIDDDGDKINLPVPDEFYFVNIIEPVNPRKWLDNDVERGWYEP